jgi:hypothetical protein
VTGQRRSKREEVKEAKEAKEKGQRKRREKKGINKRKEGQPKVKAGE